MPLLCRLLISLVLIVLTAFRVEAQTSSDPDNADPIALARATGNLGPTTVKLGEFATIDIPKGFMFVPANTRHPLISKMDRTSSKSSLGVVVPARYDTNWYVLVTQFDTGYLPAATVAKLDHVEMMATLRSAMRKGNAARMLAGNGPIDIGEWLEPPRYDAARDRFTVALRVFESGPTTHDEDFAKIDTLLFGRSKTVELSLTAFLSEYAKHKAEFNVIVDGFAFAPGHRSVDFVAGTDKAATHVMDVVFGGRTLDEIAAEAAEEAAEARRRAALPPPKEYSSQMKLVFFGVLGLLSLVLVMFAFSGRGDGGRRAPANNGAQRAIRTRS